MVWWVKHTALAASMINDSMSVVLRPCSPSNPVVWSILSYLYLVLVSFLLKNAVDHLFSSIIACFDSHLQQWVSQKTIQNRSRQCHACWCTAGGINFSYYLLCHLSLTTFHNGVHKSCKHFSFCLPSTLAVLYLTEHHLQMLNTCRRLQS